MAEVFLNQIGQGKFLAESAGLEPGVLNPTVVKVMAEAGYDLAGKPTHSVFKYHQEERKYDIVVKVCDQVSGQRCPIFHSTKISLNWSFSDPSSYQGSDEEIMTRTREVRDAIKPRIEEFVRVFG